MKINTVILLCIPYLSLVYGKAISDNLDELDTKTLEATGCKYLYIPQGEKNVIPVSSLDKVVLARGQDGENVTNFETHFAIRSDAKVIVRLHAVDKEGKTDVAFEFTYRADHVTTDVLGRGKRHFKTSVYAPDLLSETKYTNLHINLGYHVYHARECNPFPFFSKYGRNTLKDIQQIEFETTSPNGAKILYDCPVDFAKCKCNH